MNAEPSSNPQSAITRRTTLEVEEARENHSYPPLHPASSFSSTDGVQPEAASNRPLLLVKLTGYRLLTMTIIVTFGTVKAMASIKGAAVTATALEWVMGVVLSIILYWLGLYESLQPPVAMWFFHEDYILDLLYLPCLGVIVVIFASSVALVLYLYLAIHISAYMLIATKLFSPKEWTGLLSGILVFMTMYSLLLIAASCIMPKDTLSFIGRPVLRLGRHFKESIQVVVDGCIDRLGKHPFIYILVILIVGPYTLFSLFFLMLHSTLPTLIDLAYSSYS